MKCVLCEKEGKEKEATDEHHKDGNHKNNDPNNILYCCVLHHAELHGISPKKSELKRLVIMRDRTITIRKALGNQIKGFRGIEYLVPEAWTLEFKKWKAEEKAYDKEIKKLIKSNNYPMWDWLINIKGIAEITAAKLISYIIPETTRSVPALWRYCGLDPNHTKRKRGMSQKESKKCGHPYLKKELIGEKTLAENFIRQRTPIYREIYDKTKEMELKRKDKNKPKSQGHAHQRAKRKMIKVFLKDLYNNCIKRQDYT